MLERLCSVQINENINVCWLILIYPRKFIGVRDNEQFTQTGMGRNKIRQKDNYEQKQMVKLSWYAK